MKDYLTGSQLRQYLHISTRKMKYLMDHNLIPHENTGQPTHKYHILRADAEAFKLRMEENPQSLANLQGKFSSREKKPPKPPVPLDEDTLYDYLCLRWKNAPDALRIRQAAELIGTNAAMLQRLIQKGELTPIDVCGNIYFPKEAFILYLIAPERSTNPTLGNYKQIIREFKQWQCRERENERRREKRRKESFDKRK